MTQQERVQTWAKKDELKAALDQLANTAENKAARIELAEQLKAVNNALVSDKLAEEEQPEPVE